MDPQASDFDVRLGMIRAASGLAVPPSNLPTSTNGVEHRLTPAKTWCEYAGMKNHTIGILAWVLSSEAVNIHDYPQYAYAIGEAVMNAGVGLATHDKRRWLDGYFAHQSGRWCSTWQPPTWRHVRCAELVQDSMDGPDFLAHGAMLWLDCKVQVGTNKIKPATNPTPEEVVRRRYKAGYKWIGPETEYLDPFRLMLFGRDGVSIRRCLEAVEDGRRRWRL